MPSFYFCVELGINFFFVLRLGWQWRLENFSCVWSDLIIIAVPTYESYRYSFVYLGISHSLLTTVSVLKIHRHIFCAFKYLCTFKAIKWTRKHINLFLKWNPINFIRGSSFSTVPTTDCGAFFITEALFLHHVFYLTWSWIQFNVFLWEPQNIEIHFDLNWKLHFILLESFEDWVFWLTDIWHSNLVLCLDSDLTKTASFSLQCLFFNSVLRYKFLRLSQVEILFCWNKFSVKIMKNSGKALWEYVVCTVTFLLPV